MKIEKNEKFMDILEKLACSVEPAGNAKISACIVHKGSIVSFGHNQLKSHPFQLKYGRNSESIFLHAETSAIYNALKFLTPDEFKKSTLYICRVKKIKGEYCWGLSMPCEGCTRAIVSFGIKNVVYSDEGKVSRSLLVAS
jgi:deoxycytidylate deaminase